MKILWFTWKDVKNPYAGGAEVVNNELAKRLVAEGHEVIFLVRGDFVGAKKEEIINGYKVIRLGNFHTVYWEAFKYYRKNLKGWADLVIEEVNTIPFFCNFYVKEKSVLFFHQLCREIWFYEMRLPYSLVGYIAETIYLLFLGNRDVITVSNSTKKDLNRFGFRWNKIKIISEGTHIDPVKKLESCETVKYKVPTILSLGALRPMKRTDQIIEAFELAKKKIPELQLIVVGDMAGNFGKKILEMIEASPYKNSIKLLGRVSKEKKIELMQKSHLIAVTSVKEGWGLTVTEANSQGTPAVAYDIDGFRDSIKNGVTGLISEKNNSKNLSEKIVEILEDKEKYEKLRRNAWEWSKEITFEKSYTDFKKIIDSVCEETAPSFLKKVAKYIIQL